MKNKKSRNSKMKSIKETKWFHSIFLISTNCSKWFQSPILTRPGLATWLYSITEIRDFWWWSSNLECIYYALVIFICDLRAEQTLLIHLTECLSESSRICILVTHSYVRREKHSAGIESPSCWLDIAGIAL